MARQVPRPDFDTLCCGRCCLPTVGLENKAQEEAKSSAAASPSNRAQSKRQQRLIFCKFAICPQCFCCRMLLNSQHKVMSFFMYVSSAELRVCCQMLLRFVTATFSEDVIAFWVFIKLDCRCFLVWFLPEEAVIGLVGVGLRVAWTSQLCVLCNGKGHFSHLKSSFRCRKNL